MAGWMEFRVCWWIGWLGRVVNMAAPDVSGPVKPGAYDSAANGGRRGASLKGGWVGGQIGYQIGWNLKVSLSGKRGAGFGFCNFTSRGFAHGQRKG